MSNEESQNLRNTNADRGSIANTFKAGVNIENNKIDIHNVINNYSSTESEKSLDLINEIIEIQNFEPETILIPAGSFWMGSDPGEGILGYETPRHEVTLPAYRIGKYPVTNALYQDFLRLQAGTKVSPIIWNGERALPEGLEDHPVAGVTWYEALAYCEWLSKVTSRKYSLPNEAQWEKACRGGKSYLYPWGDEFNPMRCNQGRPNVASVKAYPAQNEFGCFDLMGNVLQWTCTLWGKSRDWPDIKYSDPWKDDGRNDPSPRPGICRVLRGSSMEDKRGHRCSVRRGEDPGLTGVRGARYSFRVAMTIE